MPRDDSFTLNPNQLKLRPTERMPRNSMLLADCKACKAKPESLVGYNDLDVPIAQAELDSHSITFSWPFPQIIRGKEVTLLCTATKVFVVDETTWTLTQATTYDYYIPANTKAITGSGYWHFADFYNTWFLYNGTCSVMKFGDDSKYYVQDGVTIYSGCAMRGRLILGGFDPSDYWSATWQALLAGYLTAQNPPLSNLPSTFTDVAANWVWYSTIGGGDVKFIHNPTLATSGGLGTSAHDATNPLFMDYFRRNESGWFPCAGQNQVLCVKPLGRNLIVFGYDFIDIYQQFSEPFCGFGNVRSFKYGLAGRGAVGGSEDAGYIFVDDKGYLRSIDAQANIAKLDYQEFMTEMTLGDIVVAYDESEGEFYIGDGTTTFIYVVDSKGLTRGPEAVTSVILADGVTYAMTDDLGDDEFLLVTDTFDMGIRGLKQVKGVEVGGSPDTTLEVAYDYRHQSDTSFTRTAFRALNRLGWVDKFITALELRLVLRVTTRTGNEKIDYVKVEWRAVDFRSIRGPIGQPTAGGQ